MPKNSSKTPHIFDKKLYLEIAKDMGLVFLYSCGIIACIVCMVIVLCSMSWYGVGLTVASVIIAIAKNLLDNYCSKDLKGDNK